MPGQNASELIPVPGYTTPTHTWGVQLGDRYSAPMDLELLASTARFTQIGVTVAGAAPPSAPLSGPGYTSDGRIMLGTVMGRVTATKKYVPWTSGASNGTGSDTPVGVLRHTVDTTSGDQLANVVTSGILRNSLISGAGTSAVIFGNGAGPGNGLNARYDSVNDFFIF